MRKQYHFRRVGEDTLIWDVDRLVALASGLPSLRIPLSSIRELDEAYWGGQDEDPRMTCRQIVEHMRLVAEADLSHPIILSPDGRVMDGMHRVAKALLEGRVEIEAVALEELPEPDHKNRRASDLPY